MILQKVIKSLFKLLNPPLTEEERIEKYRSYGISIGDNCKIYSELGNGRDSFLLTIGNNVTISGNVKFLMHDNGVIKPSKHQFTDVLGKIIIGNNTFIGYGSIILPGVQIADDCIIGAGSVVTKSINTPGLVYAGNPARFICTAKDYLEKNLKNCVNLDGMNVEQIKAMIDTTPELLKTRS